MKRIWARKALLIAAAAACVGIAACAAPADIDVEVGKRVTIQFADTGGERPEPEAIVDLLRGSGQVEDIRVRMMKREGQATLDVELWGSHVAAEPAADKLKAKFPALSGATISEQMLEGKVRGTLGEKLGHDFFDLDVVDKQDKEAIKLQVMKQLAEQGVEGKVDVQVEEEGGKQKVKVRVESEECDPPANPTQ